MNHMNSPDIPPVTAPATPKKKHGWGSYGWLVGISVLVFLCVFMLSGIAADYFYKRGVNKRAHGMSYPAELDFTVAIVLNPRHARAYCERGAIKCEGYDFAEAIDDFSRAIELDPKYALAYCERGVVFFHGDDYDKAIADLSKAIELNPKNTRAYRYRACVHYTQRRWSDAQADFRRCYEWGDSMMQDCVRLNLWAVRSLSGRKEAANRELAAYFEQRGKAADPWPARIAMFLLGKTYEYNLVAAVNSRDYCKEWDEGTDARYFAGMRRLMSGDKTGAADCFRKCVEMGRVDHVNHYCAKAELKALGL